MQLTPAEVESAIDHFNRGKDESYSTSARLGELERQIGDRSELARAFVQLQLQAAIGAGPIGPEKRQLLWHVASALHVTRAELAQIEAFVRAHSRSARRAKARRSRSTRLIEC